jgi:hypothetical protein
LVVSVAERDVGVVGAGFAMARLTFVLSPMLQTMISLTVAILLTDIMPM